MAQARRNGYILKMVIAKRVPSLEVIEYFLSTVQITRETQTHGCASLLLVLEDTIVPDYLCDGLDVYPAYVSYHCQGFTTDWTLRVEQGMQQWHQCYLRMRVVSN
jgi:hypothetical protein